jgi:hypothetical protein
MNTQGAHLSMVGACYRVETTTLQSTVNCSVAVNAQGDEVAIRVIALLAAVLRFVQPGCTFEPLLVVPSHLGQFHGLRPPDLLQLLPDGLRQVLVNAH